LTPDPLALPENLARHVVSLSSPLGEDRTGLLLVGHGSRSEIGTAQFLALTDAIRQANAGELLVEHAFLELQQPDIDTAVGRLLDRGVTRLITMPLLLFAAGHAKDDVPRAVDGALARRGRSDLSRVQAAHLGCQRAIVELSHKRMDEAVQGREKESCLLLVGRGSHDESATAEMYEFARLRQKSLQNMKVEVAFLAMAQPLLPDALPLIVSQGYGHIVVQPHLLFHGDLFESVERQVAEMAANCPDIQWTVTRPLADEPGILTAATESLKKAIFERCREAAIHVVATAPDD
jgi:sirohydrochlorin cobaltochelatase